MPISSVRWIAFVIALTLLVVGHAWVFSEHAQRTSALTRGNAEFTLPYRLIRPEFTVDGHMWIRHAVRLLQGEGPQMRTSKIDNAPLGREIHWNSGYAWWIAFMGWSWQKVTDEPLTLSTERAAMWVNAPLLLGLSLLFAIWATRRWGWMIGFVVGASLVASRTLYEGFWPGYADHHGIIGASLLGLLLGAYMMRGGWVPRDNPEAEELAISAARCSGIWGGVALWISAASAVPIIALVAASALGASAMTRGETSERMIFRPSVWRAWGVTGAATSLIFYLLEYFPAHLGWRLEVNHPLYAFAWLAGAELVARLMPLLNGESDETARKNLRLTALWALPLALAPAVVVLIWKSRVFLPVDPFMAGLHRTISEFLPELTRLRLEGFASHQDTLLTTPLLFICALLLLLLHRTARWGLLFSLGLSLPMFALSFYQSRWLMSVGPGLVLVLVGLLQGLPSAPWFAARSWRVAAAATLILTLAFGSTLNRRIQESAVLAAFDGVTASDARQLLYREVAQVIRESQPKGDIVLFASPNTSVNVAFYGDFLSLGTLYWENLDGLKAAAEISAARTDAEAARLIKARGVTHLAFFRDGNYILEYARLLHPGISDEEARQSFGYRLLASRQVPAWLEALPYAAPGNVPEGVDREVLVFKVNFDLKPADAAYNLAILQIRRMELDDALQTLDLALKIDPTHYRAASRRGEVHLNRKDWHSAQESIDLAVKIAPASERYQLLTQAGIDFESVGEPARAIANYERALREAVINPIAANNLAWILSTARNEKLRQPARALELARRCATLEPDNPSILSTLAAAQAATGEFNEAVTTLQHAIKLAREQNEFAGIPQMVDCMAAYRTKKLWLAP